MSNFDPLKQELFIRDHFLSGEQFKVSEHTGGILKTTPKPKDLEPYYKSDSYISHTDSKKSIKDRIYQFVKSFMLSKKANWIQREIRQGKILDYGCGTGDFLLKMENRGWDVKGVEPGNFPRRLALEKQIDVYSEISELDEERFDVITLWHVLEHIPDYENIVLRLKDMLRENGLLIIAVPNFKSYDCSYYKTEWAAWDVPRHLWHFSRMGLNFKLNSLGFKLLKEKPLPFDSFYVSLLSENFRKDRNFLNGFYRGLLSNLRAKTTREYSSITYFFKKPSNEAK